MRTLGDRRQTRGSTGLGAGEGADCSHSGEGAEPSTGPSVRPRQREACFWCVWVFLRIDADLLLLLLILISRRF